MDAQKKQLRNTKTKQAIYSIHLKNVQKLWLIISVIAKISQLMKFKVQCMRSHKFSFQKKLLKQPKRQEWLEMYFIAIAVWMKQELWLFQEVDLDRLMELIILELQFWFMMQWNLKKQWKLLRNLMKISIKSMNDNIE